MSPLPPLASPADLAPFAALGALLGLDTVSLGQAMLARPLVSATLAGALAGDAAAGLLVGAVLELFALETLPVGASRYPEWGSASVAAGALFAAHPDEPGAAHAGALALAVLVGIGGGYLGGLSMVALRRLNGRLARARLPRLAAGDAGAVIGLQLGGLALDLARGLALTLLLFALGRPLVQRGAAAWGTDAALSRAVVTGLAATVAGAAVWKLFHAVPRARWLFAGGIGVGLAALAVR